MPSCYQYNCNDSLGDHTLNDCEDSIQGGFKNIIILECNHQLVAGDEANGSTINAEIAAGRATLLKNVKIGAGAPSATTVASLIANQPDKVVKYTREYTLMDGNVNAANQAFYDVLGSGGAFGGIILHNAEEGIVVAHYDSFRAQGGLVLPDNNGEFMHYAYTFTMDALRDAVNGEYSAEPSGVFD